MNRNILKSGAIEYVATEEEKASKEKHKTKKSGKDLTDAQVKDLVYQLAKKANLI